MSKKYLSIEEAAEQLGIASAELNRLREKGVIRAFADRGTWKFKEEDVEKLGRSRQADSDPDVPLHQPDDEGSGADLLFTDEDALGTQPTIISKKQPDDSGSDSDVRLIFDDSLQVTEPKAGPPQDDSDSDVKLAGGAQAAPAKADDSDSDVKLAGTAAGAPAGGSDSDVKLVTDEMPAKASSGSDSDVRLVSSDSSGEVKLAGSGSSGSVPIMPEEDGSTILVDPAGSSVIDDESGISLGEGSDIPLASDSGISLERPNDSGISLSDESSIVLTDDSGISLAGEKSSNIKGDSGISLAGSNIKSDSGISLSKQPAGKKKGATPSPSDSDDLTGTVPLMDVPLAQDEDLLDTQMEVPSLGDSSESGELFGTGEGDSTNVITLDDDEEAGYDVTSEIPRGSAALEEDEEAVLDDEPVDVSDELVGEDDELAEDVFGAEDEDFASDVESGESQAELPIAPRGMVAAEQDWGMGTHIALWASTALMVACGTVLFDMVRNMWHTDSASHNPVASMLLDMFKNI
jgi:excisionase family DNA binding protein